MKTTLQITIMFICTIALAFLLSYSIGKQEQVRCEQLEQQSIEHLDHYYSPSEQEICN